MNHEDQEGLALPDFGELRGLVRDMQGAPRMTRDGRHLLGQTGEDLACAELRRRGYEILERRYRTRLGEIDIVARDGAVTVFVEVKARTGSRFGESAFAVTPWKQRRVGQMAKDFLARRHLLDTPCRFDVVALDIENGVTRVTVYADAFCLA
jgi:putative endonuclease